MDSDPASWMLSLPWMYLLFDHSMVYEFLHGTHIPAYPKTSQLTPLNRLCKSVKCRVSVLCWPTDKLHNTVHGYTYFVSWKPSSVRCGQRKPQRNIYRCIQWMRPWGWTSYLGLNVVLGVERDHTEVWCFIRRINCAIRGKYVISARK